MSPDKFRLWIVILLAAVLVTVWLNMGVKCYKWQKCGMMWEKHGKMMEPGAMKHGMMQNP